ncbi:MAG: hypothetical protein IKD91_04240, partial [Clostridiales bacterium]|nr:hypothetical protein [Clostridiales bacterium]MBR3463166.1 hypothetical protein [Clostridiales bacterium]
ICNFKGFSIRFAPSGGSDRGEQPTQTHKTYAKPSDLRVLVYFSKKIEQTPNIKPFGDEKTVFRNHFVTTRIWVTYSGLSVTIFITTLFSNLLRFR